MYGATSRDKDALLRKALTAAPHATTELINMAQQPNPSPVKLDKMREMAGKDPGMSTGAKVGIGVAVTAALGVLVWKAID